LIYSVGRTAAGYRLFEDEALWCVEMIRGVRALGLTVAEIGSLTKADHQVGTRMSSLLDTARARVTTRVEELQQTLRASRRSKPSTGPNWLARWISTPATRAGAETGPSPRGHTLASGSEVDHRDQRENPDGQTEPESCGGSRVRSVAGMLHAQPARRLRRQARDRPAVAALGLGLLPVLRRCGRAVVDRRSAVDPRRARGDRSSSSCRRRVVQLNFWRCQHTHCVVTATGWLVLALLALLGAALGHSLIGGAENIAFLAILLVGALVEVGWYASHRSHATPPPDPSPPRV